MKLASYKGTHTGLSGIANILIRIRLKGLYSHSEVVFEPGDGVDHLMPDGSTQPIEGCYWCASSVASERMPEWSPRRADVPGGVRFKRVNPYTEKWDVRDAPFDPLFAAQWCKNNQGMLYDWQLIIGFLMWVVPNKDDRVTCSEAVATMFQFPDAWRFDPCVLDSAVQNVSGLYPVYKQHIQEVSKSLLEQGT